MKLHNIAKNPLRVIDASISFSEYIPIDISSSNKALHTIDVSSSKEWEKYIEEYLEFHQVKVAYGGYLEVRDIYNRSEYFTDEIRNIHLGVDFWCKEGSPVLAAFEGKVHSFQNNTNYGDYGPTIILEHEFKNESFYTLYGHLSIDSIAHKKIGTKIKTGEMIGMIGDASVNGDYAPHLHFQVIKDLEGCFGDYPGVCSEEKLDFYRLNCPNPDDLLNLSKRTKSL